MAETTTATSMAGIDLALDVARDVADAVDVGDGGAAEFHDETRHAASGSDEDLKRGKDGGKRRAQSANGRIHMACEGCNHAGPWFVGPRPNPEI